MPSTNDKGTQIYDQQKSVEKACRCTGRHIPYISRRVVAQKRKGRGKPSGRARRLARCCAAASEIHQSRPCFYEHDRRAAFDQRPPVVRSFVTHS
jgi:hypothetical protein